MPDPTYPWHVVPADDQSSAELYDKETGEHVGTAYADEGQTVDDYLDGTYDENGNPQYTFPWDHIAFNGEGEEYVTDVIGPGAGSDSETPGEESEEAEGEEEGGDDEEGGGEGVVTDSDAEPEEEWVIEWGSWEEDDWGADGEWGSEETGPGFGPDAEGAQTAAEEARRAAEEVEHIADEFADSFNDLDDTFTFGQDGWEGLQDVNPALEPGSGLENIVLVEAAEPVDVLTGAWHAAHVDVHIAGIGPALAISRRYSNQWNGCGSFGMGWDTWFDARVQTLSSGAVYVRFGDASAAFFGPASGGYEAPSDSTSRLSSNGDRFELLFADGDRYHFRTDGWLDSVTDRNGNTLIVERTAEGIPRRIVDDDGRALTLTADAAGRITRVSDFSGRTWQYRYDSSGRLLEVSGPCPSGGSGILWRFNYTTGDGDPRQRANVSTMIDGRDVVVIANNYGTGENDRNRVIEQYFGGSRFQFAYAKVNASALPIVANRHVTAYRTTVTNPLGHVTEYDFNPRGAILEQRVLRTGATALSTVYLYNTVWRLTEIRQPGGSRITYRWFVDAAGNPHVSEVTHRSDNLLVRTRLVYNTAGQVISLISPSGALVTYQRDVQGRVTAIQGPSVILPDGSSARPTTVYTYDGRGRVTSVTAPDGQVADFHYQLGDGGLLDQVSSGGIVKTRWEYDNLGRIQRVIDADGETLNLTHNEADWLIAESGPLGVVRRFTYDPAGYLTISSERNADAAGMDLRPAWIDTQYEWDAQGRCTRVTHPLVLGRSASFTYEYDGVSNLATLIGPSGQRIEFRYDERGLMTERRITPNGSRPALERFEYHDSGNLVRWINALGVANSYIYDGLGRLIRHQLPTGDEVHYRWNVDGYVDRVSGMDSSGVLRLSQQHKYDPLGRLKEASMRVILPDGSSGPTVWTRTAHDIIGRPVKIVDGSGAATDINWNPDGTLSAVQDPGGNLTRYTWNAVGYLQRIEQVFPVAGGSSLSLAHNFTTDSLGRITSITDGLGNTEFYDYNSRSLLTKIIRADGVAEERGYDLAGRLISRSIPWPSTNSPLTGLHYTYDDSGELISVRDPDGCTIHYDRDERGGVERIVAADGAVLAHYVLDALGQIRETTDARGTSVSNTWDGLGRLATRRVMHAGGSAGITSETFSYDFYGNIIRAQNDHHVFTAEFDSLNRCYSEGVDGDLVRYTYGPNLDLAALTYPSGASVRYARDNLGRVSAVNFVPIGAPPASISIFWLGADRVAEMDHGNGLRTKFTYDRAGRLLQSKTLATSGPVEVLTFLRDPLFQVQLRHRMNEQVSTYSYDSGGQIRHIGQTAAGAPPDVTAWSLGGNGDQVGLSGLAASFDSATGVQYALTPGGDRTSVTAPDGTALYTQGPAHRYLNAGGANLTWDANGNLIADDNYRYRYDHCNRLTALADAAGNTLFSMTYDPIGRLRSIIRQNGTEIRQHVGLEVVEESTPAGVRTFCPAFGVDQTLAFAQGSNLYHIHRDQTWSVTALSSADGEVVERYTWGEFGELQAVYDRAFAPVNSPPMLARFQGRPQLADGILDFRQRILLSHLGRFAQVDPAGLEGDSNPYRFANNNPLLFVDPTGELFWIPIALGALIGGGIAAIANRNKSGADFWLSIIAGALGGAVAGSGLGIAGFAAGGAVSGIITGAYDGGKYGGVSGALTSGALGGLAGAAAGALGGTVGAKVSTGVTGAIYSSLTRGALRNVGRQAMGDAGRFIAASYTGTVTGGVSGGGTAGFSGGVVLGTGAMIANGQDVGESFLTGLESGYSGALDGALYGGLGGPAFKALHQSLLTVATGHPFHSFKTLNQVIGEEAEFFVRNQIGNSKATFRTPQGSQPDLWGDALPWARPVYGDVKNTAAIPGFNKQHRQLRNIFNSIPNRFHPVNNPGGNRMSIFHRPGIQLPGTRHSMATQLASGEIVLTETLQFVFVPYLPEWNGFIRC